MKKKLVSGIIVTMFLVTMVTFAIPVRVSAVFDGEVPIGIVGPKGWIPWDGVWEGAQLAADIINYPDKYSQYGLAGPGGVKTGAGQRYKIVLVDIDEHVVPVPDPTAAVAELLSALDGNPDMKILLGGFRTEVCLPMREAAMDYAAEHGRPIWIICGAAEDYIIDCGDGTCGACVRCDYERYKYMYRLTPINSTSLGFQLASPVAQFIVPKLKAMFGINPDPRVGDPLPAYLVAEDLAWCEAVVDAFLDPESQDLMGVDFVGVARPSVIETDFSPVLDAIEGSGAKMIVHIFSAVAGATFIKQWGERKVPACPVGINVESQLSQFWPETGGKCEYETFMGAAGRGTNINPDAIPLSSVEFWDVYKEEFGHSPIYTAWGTYGGITGLNDTAEYFDWIANDCDALIPSLDDWGDPTIDGVTQYPGMQGWFRFTVTHEVYQEPTFSMTVVWPGRGCPPYDPDEKPWARALIPQWQAGIREVIWPRGRWCVADVGLGSDPEPLPFARKWKVPPWVYSLAETDFASAVTLQNPPVWLDPGMAGLFGSFPLPDGTVGTHDIGAVTTYWQQTPPWTLLEADMDGNIFIDIDDVARVALDWGKTA